MFPEDILQAWTSCVQELATSNYATLTDLQALRLVEVYMRDDGLEKLISLTFRVPDQTNIPTIMEPAEAYMTEKLHCPVEILFVEE